MQKNYLLELNDFNGTSDTTKGWTITPTNGYCGITKILQKGYYVELNFDFDTTIINSSTYRNIFGFGNSINAYSATSCILVYAYLSDTGSHMLVIRSNGTSAWFADVGDSVTVRITATDITCNGSPVTTSAILSNLSVVAALGNPTIGCYEGNYKYSGHYNYIRIGKIEE